MLILNKKLVIYQLLLMIKFYWKVGVLVTNLNKKVIILNNICIKVFKHN